MKQHMMSLWGDPTSNEGEQIEKRPFLSLWALKQLIKLQDKSHKDYPEYHNLVCPSKGGVSSHLTLQLATDIGTCILNETNFI